MQFQHVNHLRAYLEAMDASLEQFEIRLEMKRKFSDTLEIIKELRIEIHKFLAYIGISVAKKDICKDIHNACLFFENDLVEMEPKRFQKGYGKLDSKSEEIAIEDFLSILENEIKELKKSCENR